MNLAAGEVFNFTFANFSPVYRLLVHFLQHLPAEK